MAGVDWGTAIAQGLAQGLGEAGQRYYQEKRDARMDRRKMKNAYDTFVKQQDYLNKQSEVQAEARRERQREDMLFKQGVEDISETKRRNEKWAQYAGKDVGQLQQDYINYMSKNSGYSGSDLVKYRQELAKSTNNKDKAYLLNGMGLTLGDYTEYQDIPEYEDAIPKNQITGTDYNLDDKFVLPPSQVNQEQTEAANVALSADEARALQYKSARSVVGAQVAKMFTGNEFEGSKVSDDVLNSLIQSVGGVDKVGTTQVRDGEELYKAQLDFLSLQKDGLIVPTVDAEGNRVFDFVQNVKAKEHQAQQQARRPRMADIESPELEPSVISDEPKRKAIQKSVSKMGNLVAENADFIGVGSQAGSLADRLEGMPKEQQQYITGVLAGSPLGIPVNDIMANLNNNASKAAKSWLQDYANVRNITLKERSGAAVTDPEFNRFKQELADPGMLSTPESMANGLRNMNEIMTTSMNRHLSAYRGTPAEQEYFRRNPDIANELGYAPPKEPKLSKPDGVPQEQWDEAINILNSYDLTEEQMEEELTNTFPTYGVNTQVPQSAQELQEQEALTTEQRQKEVSEKVQEKLPEEILQGLSKLDPEDRTFIEQQYASGNTDVGTIKAYLNSIQPQEKPQEDPQVPEMLRRR